MINRRELRASLGSRTTRRSGTKTKALPGQKAGKKYTKYRYRGRNHQPLPRVKLAKLIRAAAA